MLFLLCLSVVQLSCCHGGQKFKFPSYFVAQGVTLVDRNQLQPNQVLNHPLLRCWKVYHAWSGSKCFILSIVIPFLRNETFLPILLHMM